MPKAIEGKHGDWDVSELFSRKGIESNRLFSGRERQAFRNLPASVVAPDGFSEICDETPFAADRSRVES
jgi:hypothetical protein